MFSLSDRVCQLSNLGFQRIIIKFQWPLQARFCHITLRTTSSYCIVRQMFHGKVRSPCHLVLRIFTHCTSIYNMCLLILLCRLVDGAAPMILLHAFWCDFGREFALISEKHKRNNVHFHYIFCYNELRCLDQVDRSIVHSTNSAYCDVLRNELIQLECKLVRLTTNELAALEYGLPISIGPVRFRSILDASGYNLSTSLSALCAAWVKLLSPVVMRSKTQLS